MGSTEKMNPPKRHVVCLPYPAQGHITPMLNLAKLLHSTSSFHVSFVNTHHTHQRLLNSGGLPSSDPSSTTFRFFSIPDGLPQPNNPGTNQHIPTVSSTINSTIRQPFTDFLLSSELLHRRVDDDDDDGYSPPPVSLIVADATMNFALSVANEFGIKAALLWTASSCALLGYAQYETLCDLGVVPFKDSTFTTDGSLDEVVNYTIPSMEGIRIRDLPSFIRTTNREDPMLNTMIKRIRTMKHYSSSCTVPILLHTFDALEHDTIRTLSTSVFPDSKLLPVGPFRLLLDAVVAEKSSSKGGGGVPAVVVRSNLWKEDTDECIEWLDTMPERSVLYVNFGSLAFLTKREVEEVARGLRDSERRFLWIVRPDMVETGRGAEESFSLAEFAGGRGMIRSWCDQDRVLRHGSVAGFFTHCGWNSMLESLGHGVPMICWAYFADQQTNCWFCCSKWEVGVEVGEGELKREVVERVVREVVGGEKGRVVWERAQEWKRLALEAVKGPCGSSFLNFNDLVNSIWA